MAYNQYDQMASNFNSSFQPEDGEITVEDTEATTRSLAEIREDNKNLPVENKDELIKDQEYIQTELKVDIELLGDVTETLRSDLKQGSRASQFEAFANLMKERREHLKDYKDINIEIAKLENDSGQDESHGGTVTNNTVIFTGNEAFDMIIAARDGLDKNELDPDKEVK